MILFYKRRKEAFMKITNLSLKSKRAWFGFALVSPFVIGFLMFFLFPAIQSFIFSLNNINGNAEGGFNYIFVNFDQYYRALFIDTNFRKLIVSGASELTVKAPIIVIYSLFIAVVLNKKFPGRGLARIIFFLPVIVTSGVVLSLESGDYLLNALEKTSKLGTETMSSVNPGLVDIGSMLLNLNIDQRIIGYLLNIVDNLYSIIISSAVQITLMIAAIQSVPKSLYEASYIEGATAWEAFWKITLPMIKNYLFLSAIYTVIDSFTNSTNSVINYILNVAYGTELNFGFASALSWIYFIVIAVMLLIVWLIFIMSQRITESD